MRYALGVDGGATKTMAVVGDERGNVLGVGLGGPTNYQITGLDMAMEHLGAAVSSALEAAKLSLTDISQAVFGMAGADFPIDFENLKKGISGLYPDLRAEIVNDTWVGFRAGTALPYGGVVISGSGEHAAAAPDGRKVTGRGMGYEWGSEGGAALDQAGSPSCLPLSRRHGPKTGLEEQSSRSSASQVTMNCPFTCTNIKANLGRSTQSRQ